MNEWILVLLVFTAGSGSPSGKVMGGLPTSDACWKQARQDTPRVLKLYPAPEFEQVQWDCIQRERKGVTKPQLNPST